MQEVLLPVLGISAIIGVAAIGVITVRFASAYARRLEARLTGAAAPDPAIDQMREELDAMQERFDFLERALVAQKSPSSRALPERREHADPTARTPSQAVLPVTSEQGLG